MKTCNRCLETKELFLFSKAPTCKDGFRNYCKACQSKKKKEWYEQNKEHVLAKTKQWQEQNAAIVKQTKLKWAQQNPDYHKEYLKQYRLQNKSKINAYTNSRRGRVRQQRPIWETWQNLRDFYLNCPEGYTVDHIIPLKGILVSGLHTIANLQYLLPSENYRKSNKYAIPD